MSATERTFDRWMRELNEDVIQGEYGYEAGEFTAYPDEWRPLFDKGLTPLSAFRRALDAYAINRRERELAKRLNWLRIQAEDAAALARARGEQP